MKNLRKIGLVLVVCVFAFLMTGCENDNVEGKLEDLMTKMYADIKEDERPMLANTPVDSENIEYYLGDASIEYSEALASEPMMGSIAHSVVLVRAKDGADIEGIKTKIKEKVDPRKWICVGVEKEDVIVENRGNLIVLIMVQDENTREKLKTAFNNL